MGVGVGVSVDVGVSVGVGGCSSTCTLWQCGNS